MPCGITPYFHFCFVFRQSSSAFCVTPTKNQTFFVLFLVFCFCCSACYSSMIKCMRIGSQFEPAICEFKVLPACILSLFIEFQLLYYSIYIIVHPLSLVSSGLHFSAVYNLHALNKLVSSANSLSCHL